MEIGEGCSKQKFCDKYQPCLRYTKDMDSICNTDIPGCDEFQDYTMWYKWWQETVVPGLPL